MPSLDRLLRPKTIAVFGGAWAKNVIQQCQRAGFEGEIWPVHPSKKEIEGLPCYASVDELPAPPDASFIGVNRHLSVDIVGQLRKRNSGGAVCFASGFSEAAAEDQTAPELQKKLIEIAGDMPILGPNCYGFINYLDGALLWPDQHGGERVEKGVAIITQSSNILLNITMQSRALPLAYAITAGNQAQQSLTTIADALLDDERVTAIGLHIEGFGDLRPLQQLAYKAHRKGIPIVAIKVGRSEQARTAMVSHTNSLAGLDAGADALMQRLGIVRLHSITAFIETLKLLHCCGPLAGNRLSSMSCSGGEASLMADTAEAMDLQYLALEKASHTALRTALGPLVALANPLDYHTYSWGDQPALTATYTAMLENGADLNFLVLDFPREDRCSTESWTPALEAFATAAKQTGKSAAIVATLPENLPEQQAKSLITRGIVPMLGIDDALCAAEAAARCGEHLSHEPASPVLLPHTRDSDSYLLQESESKARLSKAGLQVPAATVVSSPSEAVIKASNIGYPLVLKALGLAHKSEADAVRLNLQNAEQVRIAAEELATIANGYLLEQQVPAPVAELLVGVVHDPAHGFLLTLAAGGVLTEIYRDSATVLLPATEQDISTALDKLRISAVINGFRGAPAADRPAIVQSVIAICQFVEEHTESLAEVEVNPLLCLQQGAIAVDALIRLHEDTHDRS